MPISIFARTFRAVITTFSRTTNRRRLISNVAESPSFRRSTYDASALEDRVMMSASPLDPGLLDGTSDGTIPSADDLGDAAGGLPSDMWGIGSDFSDASTDLFAPQSGNWTIEEGRYHGMPAGDAVSTLLSDAVLPTDLELSAVINADAATSTLYSNAFLIFDYQGANNFKFAGAYVGTDQWVIGHRTSSGWTTDASFTGVIDAATDYHLTLTIQNDNRATLYVDGVAQVAHSFAGSLTDGQLGVGTRNASSFFDDFSVRQVVLDTTSEPGSLPLVEDFDDQLAQHLLPESGQWSLTLGRYVVTPDVDTDGLSLLTLSDPLPQDLLVSATINADNYDAQRFSNGFVIFDYQSPTDFKFAGAFAARDEWSIGHRTADDWVVDATLSATIDPFTDYDIQVQIQDGHQVTLTVGSLQLEHTFADDVTDGQLGLGSYNSVARFDNLSVVDQTPPPPPPPNPPNPVVTVSVELQGHDLVISGDADSDVTIMALSPDSFQVIDHGQIVATQTGFTGNLRVELGDGNDRVTLDLGGYTLDGHVIIDVGGGTNHVTIENGEIGKHLFVQAGAGDDHIEIAETATVQRHAKLRTGTGDDQLIVAGQIGRSLWYRGGEGDDSLVIGGSVQRHVFARLGDGDGDRDGDRDGDGDDHPGIWEDATLGRHDCVQPGRGDDPFGSRHDEDDEHHVDHRDKPGRGDIAQADGPRAERGRERVAAESRFA